MEPGFKVSSGTVYCYSIESVLGTDLDISETADPASGKVT